MRYFALVCLVIQMHAADLDGWPRWRGPFDNGVARGDAPVEFSDTKNVAWKVKIAGRGFSSPVMWGDRIYVTTAIPLAKSALPSAQGGPRGAGGGSGSGIEHKFVVMCLSRKDGHVIWERTARTATPHDGYHFRYGSFASNSPVTDGKRIYAFFGSRGVFVYDMDGKPLWQKETEPLRMRLAFGEGTATVLHGDKLLLNFDQEQNSHLDVLDAATGKTIWQVAREEESSWSAPLVIDYKGRKQVIVSATKRVRSYDLETGKVKWECGGLGPNVIPAPVVLNDVVYVMSGFRDPNLMAIRLDRTGDLTGTDAVLWQSKRGISYTASPVLHDGKLYFVSDNGMLSCLNAKTGEVYYQTRLPKPYNFKASPGATNGRLYLSTEEGDVLVIKMGEKFEVLATNTFADQSFISTPAIADGDIYLRSETTLYCIRTRSE